MRGMHAATGLEPIMAMPLPAVHRRLRHDELLRFDRARGLRVCAEQGALWITIDGAPGDITLEPGACRVFDLDMPVLVGTFRGEAVLSAHMLRTEPTWRDRLLRRVPRMAEAA